MNCNQCNKPPRNSTDTTLLLSTLDRGSIHELQELYRQGPYFIEEYTCSYKKWKQSYKTFLPGWI